MGEKQGWTRRVGSVMQQEIEDLGADSQARAILCPLDAVTCGSY
jgi:hypothetical protein